MTTPTPPSTPSERLSAALTDPVYRCELLDVLDEQHARIRALEKLAVSSAKANSLHSELAKLAARYCPELKDLDITPDPELLRNVMGGFYDFERQFRELKARLAELERENAELRRARVAPCERCELNRDGFGFDGMLPPHTCTPEEAT